MDKYKCLKKVSNGRFIFPNKIFDGNYVYGVGPLTVQQLYIKYPNDWKLIKENDMEKTLTITLDKAREIYGKSKEMDELLLANFSREELEKAKLPTKWEDLKEINGYYLLNKDYRFVGIYTAGNSSPREGLKDVFATEKQARSCLAMAQLSQLMAVYNDGWEADWNNTNETKYVIRANNNSLFSDYYSTIANFLAFNSAAVRNEFMKNFESLIKEYFMID